MLRELTKNDWMSMLDIPANRVPQALILWGTRNLKRRYAAMRERFDDVLEVGSPNGLLEDVLIGRLGNCLVAYASVYGAPMASEVVHLFGVLGARLVVQVGTCGGFGEGLRAGDIFVAEEAYCGEGASQYYKTNGKTVAATELFLDASDKSPRGVSIRRGRLYTTSALFAEGADDIERWAGQGFSAVDMETSATFAVAEYFGMERGALLSVFDNPRGEDHILATDLEKDERRLAAQHSMVEIAFTTILKRIGEIAE